MDKRMYFNEGWKFTKEFDECLLAKGNVKDDMVEVRIPHTVADLPFHYFDEHEYQMISGYKKVFMADSSWENKVLLLTFEGVAHDSKVYVNGNEVYEHHCGYTAFTIDISKYVSFGKENEIVVRVDSNENLNVPPFGFVIDYMTYGGIYRDVYLDVKEESYIKDIFVKTKISEGGEQSQTLSDVEIVNAKEGLTIVQSLRKYGDEDYKELSKCVAVNDSKESYTVTQDTGSVDLWDIYSPNLYQIRTRLVNKAGDVIDEKIIRFGYRKAVFHKDGFYLNNKKIKIRGLNRHQSYAYTGYAMPRSMQELDAVILKNELGVNAVRTSHYPQSQYFIDKCDELGLLVFTEIPGWQHIGDADWKNQAVENVRDMIVQYRNHASIILWGVRINESVDDDEFYARTNALARSLDPTRQTGGVRCYKKGSFLEDVYTYNDFSHTGNNKGCDNKSAVTSDVNKPYLISEYNGHMYPCKSFDWEERRRDHALRHANVLEDVASADNIAGSFGWCMFDYNTHKDFGSGDRICYHGVMDMFRNPKLAASVYAAQQDDFPVLELSSSMDIGEHPGSNRGDIYIFTNADSVKMYKNDHFIKEYTSKDSEYKSLKHGPIRINDYIGDSLEVNEKMSKKQADAVKELLNETARAGLYNLTPMMYVKAAGLVARYHMKMSDAVELYNKYIGDWGGTSTSYTFEAIKNGEVIKSLNIKPMTKAKINAVIDHSNLVEDNTYDVAAIRINAVDENQNILHFYNDPVSLSVEGPIELIGPNVTALFGGMGGTYVRTTGGEGAAKLVIKTIGGDETVINMNVSKLN